MIDFFRESANYMALDRPDIWTQESALETLVDWHEGLSGVSDDEFEESGGLHVESGSFRLSRFLLDKDGNDEYSLSRIVSVAAVFRKESTVVVAGLTENSQTINPGVNLTFNEEGEDFDSSEE